MFSDAISSISWRCRPSSPRMAAAMSGSASVRGAAKNESGAEALLALEDEGLIGEYLHRRNLLDEVRSVTGGDRKRRSGDTISDPNGQALAVQACYLFKLWWGWGSPLPLAGRGRGWGSPGTVLVATPLPDPPPQG